MVDRFLFQPRDNNAGYRNNLLVFLITRNSDIFPLILSQMILVRLLKTNERKHVGKVTEVTDGPILK